MLPIFLDISCIKVFNPYLARGWAQTFKSHHKILPIYVIKFFLDILALKYLILVTQGVVSILITQMLVLCGNATSNLSRTLVFLWYPKYLLNKQSATRGVNSKLLSIFT